ncbi:tyrosine-type recombinase/integrase [Microcoleus sp. B5-D4]|uniref:tyrosine-type recombinase/integrase n=1 Tax=unclassified Microcoleus TaxID=2642155 RepID=UPI002FD5960B
MRADKRPQQSCDVSVTRDGNSLRLAFPKRHTPLWEQLKGKSLKGKPNYLYLTKYGFSADNPEDWKRATQLAIAMESDLDHPEWEKLFDPTLAKYGLGGGKYAKLADVLQLPGAKQPEPEITVGEMWEAYLEWKKTVIEESTFVDVFKTMSNTLLGKVWDRKTNKHIQSGIDLSVFRLDDKANILIAIENMKMSRKTYFINELNRAFDFSKIKGMLVNPTTENPFTLDKFSTPAVTTQQKYASKIVNGEEKEWHEVQDEKDLENDRRAFTKEERDTIIKAFYESEKASDRVYAPLIEFYFLTGCRTAEAIPLTWKDVDFERNLIRFNKSLGVTTRKLKDTKTGEMRFFYFSENSRLRELLLKLKSESLNNLVFPSEDGKYRHQSAIAKKWRGFNNSQKLSDGTKVVYTYPGVVTQLANDGKISGYLPLYHTRHTYITLTAHANRHDNNALLYIATACGNSVDVILRHYLGMDEKVKIVEV